MWKDAHLTTNQKLKHKIPVFTQHTVINKIMTILSVVKYRACYVQNSVISGNGYDRYSVMHIEKYF